MSGACANRNRAEPSTALALRHAPSACAHQQALAASAPRHRIALSHIAAISCRHQITRTVTGMCRTFHSPLSAAMDLTARTYNQHAAKHFD